MRAVYYPFSGNGNEYCEQMKEIVASVYGEVVPLKAFLTDSEVRNSTGVIFLNWLEDLNSKQQWKNIAKYVLRLILLSYLRHVNAKLVYVMHNVTSHDHRLDKASTRLRIRLIDQSNAIMILSSKSRDVLRDQLGEQEYRLIEHKIMQVQMPNCCELNERRMVDYRKKFRIAKDQFVFLFTGIIRPYKRIELIIRLAEESADVWKNAFFLVVGKARDRKYMEDLVNSSMGLSNIKLVDEFIPAEEMEDLIKSGDISILPLDMQSSLNSSSCIHSLSCGRNVIVPLVGTVADFPEALAFTYQYSDWTEEYEALKKAAGEAYKLYQENPALFNERQAKLSAFVASEYSQSRIGDQCREMLTHCGAYEDVQ